MGSKFGIRYILDDDGVPVREDSMTAWAKWFEQSENGRRVAFSEFDWKDGHHLADDRKIIVSTVFLGIDHAWGVGPPLLFETMVFGGAYEGRCERTSTRDEAVAQHETVCREVRASFEETQ